MTSVVTDDPAAGRFELRIDGALVSTAAYTVLEDSIRIDHVQTDPAQRGNGRAAQLMAGMLDQIRASGRAVVPVCSYAVDYMAGHPDTHDLLR